MDNEILEFIKSCIKHRRIFWTYHVNMRLTERLISREEILSSVETYEIIEQYPKDKYLPSYLVYSKTQDGRHIHVQMAVDAGNGNIRIVTAYMPTLDKWEVDFKTRRKQ